ncbi:MULTISPECIES: S1 family peptidase [Nocardiopsidaceae]|uniref:S1 family peptidase n=1 Tax=Streptomonospora nanhaiensis TaxID=1323731 RepID=A0ABY6YGX2_9ACTN|nr:S1 family peptidase [Streptomonospora nanhaiensis]WAE71518.1 S1 family peptidase [Streptomonospora nanhaiensis]
MRPSPVISAIGTGALAFGLAFSVTPGATAAVVPAEPAASGGSATMLEALERDLGLTPLGAEALLEAQESAFETDTEATEAAGDAYGGSLFDPETQELTVLVTDAAAVDAVEAAGAEATVVSYGTEGLAQVVDELDAVGAPEGVVGWYPDVERDTVVIQVTEGASADGLIEASGVDASAFEVQETVEAPRLLAEIVGGEAYYMGGGRCSIGFAVQGGFVTAGHCGTAGTTAESSDGTGSGVFEESVFPGSDGAYVAATSNWTGTNRVEGSSSTVSGSTQAPIGSAVCRSGSTTGWHCGTIEARGQTVSYPEGTVEDLTRTDVCAEPGDSGGSFISGSQAQGVTSGGSGDCTSGGTTYYQEVGPLLSSWGLSLVTG